MIKPQDLLRPTPAGLYCPPGDFYIDPVRPVARAIVTHGHADHARPGHGAVLATPETLDIMALRMGEDAGEQRQPLDYGEHVSLNGVDIRLAPAGHVLGSAQVVVERQGCRIVVSGDYKRRPDPTCAAFEPVACDVFVSEATFALPVFRHPPDPDEIGKLLASMRLFPERCHLLGVYALGKAQRVLALLRQAGFDAPIYLHGALTAMCELYRRHGIDLGELRLVADTDKADLAGQLVLAPPSALQDRWTRRLPDPLPAFASGWMGVRARARQRAVELPLIISDHADWDELTATTDELAPAEIWVTHGREEALVHYAHSRGQRAQALALVGYDEDAA